MSSFIPRIWVSQKGDLDNKKPVAPQTVEWEEYVRADLYAALRPVPVDQVPAFYKSGRHVVLHWSNMSGLWAEGFWNLVTQEWESNQGYKNPTHVSLPLPPAEVPK